MKKVYCKNCRHKKSGLMDRKTFCITYHEYTGLANNPSLIILKNGDGKCPDYKRKWYKFWI